MVLEVHPAYAVVLDEEGRFLKAANLRYQVGDTVQDIVELRPPREKRPALWKPLSGAAGLAACLCLVFFGYYQPNFTPYGALRIQINPDVELTLSRTDRVLELEGLNADGQSLIEGYVYSGKDREDVTEELVERAIDMGYLSGGETVSITVTSSDAGWQVREEQAVREALEERYGETIVIQIGPPPEEPPAAEVVIPIEPPPEPAPEPTPGPAPGPAPELAPEPVPEPPPEQAAPPVDSDGTDDGTGSDGAGYQDTDYGPDADGVTGYAPPDAYTDGDTDYEDRDDDGSDDDGGDDEDDEDDGDGGDDEDDGDDGDD